MQRLEVARIIGDMYSELCTLCNLGNCLRAKGSLNQALEYYQMVSRHYAYNTIWTHHLTPLTLFLKDLEMAQSLGDDRMEELLQNNLGVTFELLNQLENAISCYTMVSVCSPNLLHSEPPIKGPSEKRQLPIETLHNNSHAFWNL